MTTPRHKAWSFLLDKMAATFANGDIGISDNLNDEENESVCTAGLQIVRDMRKQRLPKEKP